MRRWGIDAVGEAREPQELVGRRGELATEEQALGEPLAHASIRGAERERARVPVGGDAPGELGLCRFTGADRPAGRALRMPRVLPVIGELARIGGRALEPRGELLVELPAREVRHRGVRDLAQPLVIEHVDRIAGRRGRGADDPRVGETAQHGLQAAGR